MAKTASELLKELNRDPAYRKMKRDQEKRIKKLGKECDADERELLKEIYEAGIEVGSVYDFVNSGDHYPEAYPVLQKHLKLPHHPRIREGIIRALTVKDFGKEIELDLLEELRKEKDNLMRWTIANALKTAMPYHRRKKYPEIKDAWENYSNHNTEQGSGGNG
ncbi:MAG: hypothetical protein AAGH40_14660 [Verrucomicrobiota bacterium]